MSIASSTSEGVSKKQLLMGNEAIAHGAIAAGVQVVTGYPGTPSTEVLETIAKHNSGDIHVEWSTNEKAAMEVAAGASYAGARVLVTMKQVGLNVASDPLMVLAYIGVRGGMVILVADDPGPISSQTEQDTRTFAVYAKLPIFDPSSPEEAYAMMADAFALSEKYRTPVIMRPTTRVCHATAPIEIGSRSVNEIAGFERSPRWIIFPKRALEAHGEINERLPQIASEFDEYSYNQCYDVLVNEGDASASIRLGIVTGGISDAYTLEALALLGSTNAPSMPSYRMLHIATPHPFPEALACDFLDGLDEVIVFEELDPALERALLQVCGKHHLSVRVCGKLTGDTSAVGENTTEGIAQQLRAFFAIGVQEDTGSVPQVASTPETLAQPALPVRPPVLCAGCPHRGSFYAVKQALKGRKVFLSGDIGCYTLGNALPLDMVDTCLCMGAGITIAQGMSIAEPNTVCLAFTGDSTFFASGITGVVNAFYNQHNITLIVLDNSITAMTGQQPHPGTGQTMMGSVSPHVSIDAVLRAIGLTCIVHANPLDLAASVAAVQEAVAFEGVSAVIFESPCVSLFKPEPPVAIDTQACTGCRRCIRELGCPALFMDGKHAAVDFTLCHGCNLCVQLCTFEAIIAGSCDTQEGGAQ